jgi:hypothetical protein
VNTVEVQNSSASRRALSAFTSSKFPKRASSECRLLRTQYVAHEDGDLDKHCDWVVVAKELALNL